MKKIEYRKLRSSESKKYRFLRLESLEKYPNSFGSKYEEQKQREKLAFENFIEQSNPECFIIGAILQDKLIGICGFYRHTDIDCNHRGEIIQMYVQPEYQGNQIVIALICKSGYPHHRISILLDIVQICFVVYSIFVKAI